MWHNLWLKDLNLRTSGKCSPEYIYTYYDSNSNDLYNKMWPLWQLVTYWSLAVARLNKKGGACQESVGPYMRCILRLSPYGSFLNDWTFCFVPYIAGHWYDSPYVWLQDISCHVLISTDLINVERTLLYRFVLDHIGCLVLFWALLTCVLNTLDIITTWHM